MYWMSPDPLLAESQVESGHKRGRLLWVVFFGGSVLDYGMEYELILSNEYCIPRVVMNLDIQHGSV